MERIVQRVTADAEHGLGGCEQVRRHGSMRCVTGAAILGHRSMLVGPRSHEILVTACTALIGPSRADPRIFVGVVATDAGHPTFGHRVMAGIAELGAHVPVALDAELGSRIHVGKSRAIEFAQREPTAIVRIVAVTTDQARFGMSAQPPLQVGIASGGVAGEAIPAARVANVRHRLALRVQAPSPVAAFAVRVVDRHRDLPVHVLVADPTFFRAFGKSAHDGFGAPRTHWTPHHRRASDPENQCGQDQERRVKGSVFLWIVLCVFPVL